jgi:hypothetical protein
MRPELAVCESFQVGFAAFPRSLSARGGSVHAPLRRSQERPIPCRQSNGSGRIVDGGVELRPTRQYQQAENRRAVQVTQIIAEFLGRFRFDKKRAMGSSPLGSVEPDRNRMRFIGFIHLGAPDSGMPEPREWSLPKSGQPLAAVAA